MAISVLIITGLKDQCWLTRTCTLYLTIIENKDTNVNVVYVSRT